MESIGWRRVGNVSLLLCYVIAKEHLALTCNACNACSCHMPHPLPSILDPSRCRTSEAVDKHHEEMVAMEKEERLNRLKEQAAWKREGQPTHMGPRPPWPYLGLAALRCLLIAAPGYLHPDEFFQGGQELFASLLLNVPGCFLPWEFHPRHALRSVAFPYVIRLACGALSCRVAF